MGDIFEGEADDSENLEALEDDAEEEAAAQDEGDAAPAQSSEPMHRLRLEYSRENLYAKTSRFPSLKAGDKVVAATRYGCDIAVSLGEAKPPKGSRRSEVVDIIRLAGADDLRRAAEFKEKEKGAAKIFRDRVAARHLEMKLVAAHFLVDGQKALFFFSADNRVDFRELVKDLVSVFHMRIELRQIGARDESRVTGGLGVCGRPFCCASVSDKLRPVSIRMAKDQNLSLNSSKISGQCGRLLCCLSYEADWYNEARRKLPAEGARLFYDGSNFRITEVNLISSMVKMAGEDGRMLEVNAKRFSRDGASWKIE